MKTFKKKYPICNSFAGLLALLLLLVIVISCGNDKAKHATSETDGCFKAYVGKLDQMLTKEDILKYYDLDFSKVEMEYDKEYTSIDYQQCIYSWESDTRTMTISNMEFPANNRIGVGSLVFYGEEVTEPVRTFTNTYHLTEAEKNRAHEALNKSLNDKKEQAKKTGKAISNSMISKIKFEPVMGIGDAAVWDYFNSSLKVLKGNARFDVIVDISDEVKVNKALAQKLAKTILAKCG